jgi:hypothetical protein
MSFVSTLALAWNRYAEPLYNWIPAGVQALSWRKKKQEGLDILSALERLAPDHAALQKYFVTNDWSWQSDPLGGSLDFTSKLWVICVKRGGDCDDFAALWHHLYKKHGEVEMVITGKKWSFHKMMCYTSGGICYLFSNLKLFRVVPEKDKGVLDKAFYKDDTWFTVMY